MAQGVGDQFIMDQEVVGRSITDPGVEELLNMDLEVVER